MPARKTVETPETSDFPSWWDWDEDGKFVEGAFVRAGTGFTQMGPRPFVVLYIEGVEKTIWLHHSVLKNQFAREVHRRPDRMIHAGETIQIWQLDLRESASNSGRSYVDYRVSFVDAPEVSQAEIFGPPPEGPEPEGPKPDVENAAIGGGVPDNDIPFA